VRQARIHANRQTGGGVSDGAKDKGTGPVLKGPGSPRKTGKSLSNRFFVRRSPDRRAHRPVAQGLRFRSPSVIRAEVERPPLIGGGSLRFGASSSRALATPRA
jgi:hypothetical protein